MLTLKANETALVLIDLQNGILALPTQPYSSEHCLQQGKNLAQQFRDNGSHVVLVNVGWHDDYGDVPGNEVDSPTQRPEGGMPGGWSELAEGLAQPNDLRVTKRQWGAFTGTELDLQLRRRGIKNIVIGGIATNMGVESTVRHGWELGYNMVVLEDACSGLDTDLHQSVFKQIFPKIAKVATTKTFTLK
ncbi:hydrolase [Vibrio sp.]|nr:hydrolase [Vibrio sp.]